MPRNPQNRKDHAEVPQTVVVLGARNLSGVIIDHFLTPGWNAAGVARSEETLDRVRLDRVRTAGAPAPQADASDPQTLASALERARRELGSLDAVVNAVSATRVAPATGTCGNTKTGRDRAEAHGGASRQHRGARRRAGEAVCRTTVE